MLYFITSTNSYVRTGQPFTIDGLSYAANWLGLAPQEEIERIGLVPVTTVGNREDESLYWVTEELNGPTLTITNIRKSQEMLAQAEKAKAKDEIESIERNSLLPRVLRVHLLSVLPTDSYEYSIVDSIDKRITELRTIIAAPITTEEPPLMPVQ